MEGVKLTSPEKTTLKKPSLIRVNNVTNTCLINLDIILYHAFALNFYKY